MGPALFAAYSFAFSLYGGRDKLQIWKVFNQE
jgi:hypothetical protein